MNALDFLVLFGDNVILQKEKYYNEGRNGPWNQKETLARIYSHYSVLFSRLYMFTNNKKYLIESERLLGIIIDEFIPMSAAVWHRKGPDCDLSNGLMGQAWTLEAFYTHFNITNDTKYLQFCESLINKHKFDSKESFWRILNVDGSFNAIDFTFNHQLWFYTMVKLFSKISTIDTTNIINFEKNFDNSNNFYLSSSRPIRHPSFGSGLLIPKYRRFKYLKSKLTSNTYNLKESGYHLFNLIAFSKLEKENLLPNSIKPKVLKNIHNFLNSKGFKKLIYASPYSFSYNPPGFELGIVLSHFNITDKNLYNFRDSLIKKQFSMFNFQSLFYSVSDESFDIYTNTSRIYELSLIDSDSLKKINI